MAKLEKMSHLPVKSRFAPSPTGDMHLGNLRTALFNALFAEKNQGTFLLRIEDTDQSRGSEASLQGLLRVLKTMSLDWQEGVEADKGHGPYRQSERADIYTHYYNALIEAGRAYPCFCTDVELSIARKTQLAAGQAPKYAGKCRNLSPQQRADLLAKGLKPTLRFKVMPEDEVRFNDLVKGEQQFKGADLGDFIIRREDHSATFLFCNAIDDSLMGVTHALRGDDHLSNTPRQMLILKVLNRPAPHYGHMPLILGDDGAPLSKRNGSLSAENLLEMGFFPIAILNYLARLGHHIEADTLLSRTELAQQFEIEHVAKSAARFDIAQLSHWQKGAMQSASDEIIAQWLQAILKKEWALDAVQQTLLIELVRQNGVRYEDVTTLLNNLFELTDPESEAATILQQTDKAFFEAAIESLQYFPDWKGMTQYIKDKTGKSGKALFAPLRVGLTGTLHGPEMAMMIRLMGQESVKTRWARFI